MSPPTFIDANVPMYAAGGAHRYRVPAREVLGLAALHPRSFMTSVEVLQELLHRYLSPGQWVAGREVLHGFAALMRSRVEPVFAQDVDEAMELAEDHQRINSRDLVHVAVMRRLGLERIVSADRHFDEISGIERLDPGKIDEWRDSVLAADESSGTAPWH